ncbi:DNA-binding transcriptional regulator CsiR [Pseudomonas sp. CES]|uniref:DNA-binding transcriptional regulator CsiR n=1 Tax=Pseudomonas sp. CES TaxID=2719586 RepID=UPI001470819F|nr:DNA-binding transcriptional regulator CsiR [Pseudomonas sp. CES]KAF4559677.1 DNA-binding transcriptional regulator CsiR [Pseudomonas sp. CES]
MDDITLCENASDAAYSRLKADILQGGFRSGEKLLMSTLKGRYGLGVGPMREVLARLVAERLVSVVNQKGYRVAPMSFDEMRDVYQARAHLEAMIVGLAIVRGDETWEASIIAQSHTLSKVVELHSPQEMVEVWDLRHKAFHNAIASGCGSKSLLQARAFLQDQAERYRQIWLKRTVLSENALRLKREEHAELVNAILERDAEKASKMMLDHLMTPVPIITQMIQSSTAVW